MQIIEFKDLYFKDFNMHRLFAMNQQWKNGSEFSMQRTRKTSALMYLKDCRAQYITHSGRKLEFPRGSILYIPQNSIYKTKFFACSESMAYTRLVEFELLNRDGEPFICGDTIMAVATDEKEYYGQMFDELVTVYQKSTYSYAEFKSALYALIARIAKHYQKEKIYSKEFYAIAPAINYLSQNPYANHSVTELANVCHISEGSFRMLFKKYAGKAPQEYCMDIKMKKARKLLVSNMYSVSKIATMLGYNEPGYFSKVFKKEVGVSPKEYIQRN